jgi:hypothetical protein
MLIDDSDCKVRSTKPLAAFIALEGMPRRGDKESLQSKKITDSKTKSRVAK